MIWFTKLRLVSPVDACRGILLGGMVEVLIQDSWIHLKLEQGHTSSGCMDIDKKFWVVIMYCLS